ncbi:MAG TPA: hypothetical protein VJT31_22915, partial [Rugosimonospora sp.]|nr:hypothetical protein [Rugosimonospora sp.]
SAPAPRPGVLPRPLPPPPAGAHAPVTKPLPAPIVAADSSPDPELTAGFNDNSIADHGTTQLTMTISRTDTGSAATGLAFTVTLPSDLVLFDSNASTTCGAGIATGTQGGSTVALSGGTMAIAISSCTVSATVTSTASGSYEVTSDSVSNLSGLLNTVTRQTLAVTPADARLSASFSPGTLPRGHVTTLTFSLARTDTNLSGAQSGLGFGLTLPTGLVVATGTRTDGCGGTLTAATGQRDVTLSGGSLTASHSSCTMSLKATAAGAGHYTVNPGNVTSVTGVTPFFGGCEGLTPGLRPHTICGAHLTVTMAPPPTEVTAVAGVASLTASWTPPLDTTGITGYLALADPGAAWCTTTGTSCVMGGTAGVTYTVTVIALSSSLGNSDVAGPSNEVTPTGPPVPATPPGTSLTLTTDKGLITTVSPSEHLVVIGTGFAAYSTAVIVIYSNPVVLGTTVTDAHGDFSKPVTVPASLTAGHHTVVASGVDPRGLPHFLHMGVDVAQEDADDDGEGGGDDLAHTGTDAASLLLAGGVLTLTGLLARLGGRRPGRRRYSGLK